MNITPLAAAFLASAACEHVPDSPGPTPVQIVEVLEPLALPTILELPPVLMASTAMSNDGNRLAVATRTREVYVVDIARGAIVVRVSTGARDATSIAWSRDDERLSTLGLDGDLRVLDSRTGRLVARLRAEPNASGHWGTQRRQAFVADDEHIAVGAGGRPGELFVTPLDGIGRGRAMSFATSRSGRLVAIGDERGDVRVWDTATGERHAGPWIVPVAERIEGFLALDFAPDDSLLAIGGGGGVVRLCSLDGTENVRELGEAAPPGWPDAVGCVRFSPDGNRLVATQFPAWSKFVWHVASGALLSEERSDSGNNSVVGAWFSRDGECIVFGDKRRVCDAYDLSREYSKDTHNSGNGYRSDGVHVWDVTGGMLRVFRVSDGATVLEIPGRT